MRIDDLASAPNPQFARPGWQDLNGEWRFRFDDEGIGRRDRWFTNPELLDRTITVPFPPESQLSGIHDTEFHPIAWYAREITDTRAADGDRLLIQFGAVDYEATVWVDGVQVGTHRGGHTPFTCDVSDALDPKSKRHWLVVRSYDDPVDAEQPRGKQDWLPDPHIIWYHRTSGIWQSVWSEVAPDVRIEDIRWRFDAARWLVDFEVALSGAPAPGSMVSLSLLIENKPISVSQVTAGGRTVSGQMSLGTGIATMDNGRLVWSPEHPNLIETEVRLVSPGRTEDVVVGYIGLRTLDWSTRQFRINGRSTRLRFVLNQGYWPESQLSAPSPAALKREVELILELGFNGARTHQKIEDPRFLYWADRLGLLLWGECANAFTYSERAIERRAVEWREAVLRDRNHPSVIAWVPFNESWGISEVGHALDQQHAVSAAYHLTHQLDGTRPVVGNDGWENVAGDLFTVHDYSWEPDTLRKRYTTESDLEHTQETYFPASRRMAVGSFDPSGKPVMVTEFGGVSFAPDSGEEWFGYGKVTSDEEFVDQYRALTAALLDSEVLCGVCYTQLTDTEQETNGLLTEDRKPKVAIEKIRAATRSESA